MTRIQLSSAKKVFLFIKHKISFTQEEFWVIALTSGLECIDARCLFRGTVDQCLVHPRDIFRYGCQQNASRLILCHSHPSGNPTPSEEDLNVTRDICLVGQVMKIPIEDHLVASQKRYFSFRDHGLIGHLGAVAKLSKT